MSRMRSVYSDDTSQISVDEGLGFLSDSGGHSACAIPIQQHRKHISTEQSRFDVGVEITTFADGATLD